MITADADIKITRHPPKCKLCGRTLDTPFGELFMILFESADKVLEKHQGIRICADCYNKLKLEIGISQ